MVRTPAEHLSMLTELIINRLSEQFALALLRVRGVMYIGFGCFNASVKGGGYFPSKTMVILIFILCQINYFGYFYFYSKSNKLNYF